VIRARQIVSSLAQSLLVLMGTALVVFFLFSVLPGDPAQLLAGNRASEAQVEMLKNEMGLDDSNLTQFMRYLNDLSPVSIGTEAHLERWQSTLKASIGDYYIVLKPPYMRRSYVNGSLVSQMIWNALLETLVLAISAILLALLVGVLFGIWAARKPDSWREQVLTIASASGMAIPSFLSAILIAWIFGYLLGEFTGLNMTGSLFTYDVYEGRELLSLKNLILPAMALSIRPMSMVALLVRNSMKEIMQRDFIRTARAKGLGERVVIYKHALLNAIAPVVTASLTWLVSLLTGAIFVEFVFGWKGLGHIVVTAIENYDLPVIMGVTLVVSAFFVLTNWFLKVIYPILDPAVRSQENSVRA